MTKNIITYSKNIENKRLDRHNFYSTCDYTLSINGEELSFDIEGDFKQGFKERKAIGRSLFPELCDTILGLIPEGYEIVVRFSGLHNDFKGFALDFKRYSIILHYHMWPIKLGKCCDEENFVLIDCEKKTKLKQFLKKYWFSIAKEQRMEVIILKSKDYENLLKWSQRVEGKRKELALLKMSLMIIDNQTGGFHFRISSNKKDRLFFESLMNKEIEFVG